MISIRHECCMPDSLYSNNAGMKNIYRIKADTISSLNRKNEKQLTDVAVKFRDEFSQPLFLYLFVDGIALYNKKATPE